MGSLLFYVIIILILAAVVSLFIYKRRKIKEYQTRKQMPLVNFDTPSFTKIREFEDDSEAFNARVQSPYDPNLIVLQLNAFPGKPYMGYELHQTWLDSGLRFGEMNIFHRYDDTGKGNLLFSLAAATPSGSFAIEDMGAFKCGGLLMFMRLDSKQKKLMNSFDLMLDIARQLTEELGGEIYDDLRQSINAEVIKRLREKICTVETHNLYSSDLLDNLD